jgi:hypothetical protein
MAPILTVLGMPAQHPGPAAEAAGQATAWPRPSTEETAVTPCAALG